MTAELLAEHADARAYHADWRALLDVVRDAGGCDALIVDAPYSKRTHAGHDDGVDQSGANAYKGKPSKRTPDQHRRSLAYSAWSADDVDAFVAAWAEVASGWMVSITDHTLAPVWQEAMERAGRYAFSPLACVRPGSRVRLVGDGPSQWSEWAVVARPRTRAFQRWGTLPGAYVVPPGQIARNTHAGVTGGKPSWLMERLVEDYSRPGDLVVDPCMGAGTTLLAAQRTGRRAIGGDAMREHAELAARRISRPAQQPLFAVGER